ncbi:MAG: DUF2061 domain-containing protein [Bacteroidota bacterium]
MIQADMDLVEILRLDRTMQKAVVSRFFWMFDHHYMSTPHKESHLRSIIKGLTWRVVASATILVITYFTTGDMETALTVTGIEFFVKLLLYYLHERIWQQVPRGAVRKLFGQKPEELA